MKKPPLWFVVATVIALLWNAAGLVAVLTDLRLSAADIAALPADQQALYAARPAWSIVGSLFAVAAGTLGCLLLLLRKRWATMVFAISLVSVIVQDLGIFIVAGAGKSGHPVPFVLQGLVLLVAIALLLLARSANRKSWLT